MIAVSKIITITVIITLMVISVLVLFVRLAEAHNTFPSYTFDGYWWLDDDASGLNAEDNTGFGAGNVAQETDITGVQTNSNVRLRVDVSETANQDQNLGISLRLEYATGTQSCTAAVTWVTLTTTSNTWKLSDSVNITDNDATDVDRISGNAKAFIAGQPGSLNDSSNPDASGVIDNRSGEWEWSIKADSGAPANQLYTFRVTDNGTLLNSYSVTNCPRATIASGNSPPDEPSNVTLNDGSAITLVENTTVAVTLKASTTDPDGAADLVSATGTIFRSGVTANCSADDNNCYRIPSSGCVFSASTSTVTCTANVWFHADPTDASSTFSAQDWQGHITVTDAAGATNSSSTATGVELQTLWAINITPTTINYGSLVPDATSTNVVITAKNTGNAAIDVELSGTDMSSGTSIISVGQQKYASSTISNWNTCTNCTALSTIPTRLEMDLPKPTSSSTAVEGGTYWMLNIPAGTASGTYSGTNTFGAIGD